MVMLVLSLAKWYMSINPIQLMGYHKGRSVLLSHQRQLNTWRAACLLKCSHASPVLFTAIYTIYFIWAFSAHASSPSPFSSPSILPLPSIHVKGFFILFFLWRAARRGFEHRKSQARSKLKYQTHTEQPKWQDYDTESPQMNEMNTENGIEEKSTHSLGRSVLLHEGAGSNKNSILSSTASLFSIHCLRRSRTFKLKSVSTF